MQAMCHEWFDYYYDYNYYGDHDGMPKLKVGCCLRPALSSRTGCGVIISVQDIAPEHSSKFSDKGIVTQVCTLLTDFGNKVQVTNLDVMGKCSNGTRGGYEVTGIEDSVVDRLEYQIHNLTEVLQDIKGGGSMIVPKEVKEFVSNMSAGEQEAILYEMMKQGRIAVHIEGLGITYDVDDVYDNSNVDAEKVLTILFLERLVA